MRRGDVIALKPRQGARGHEQRGRRYGVVVQASDLLGLTTVIAAPTSTRALAASFRPEVVIGGTRTRVLVDQLTAVDRSRLGRRQGTLSGHELAEVDRALSLVLGLRP